VVAIVVFLLKRPIKSTLYRFYSYTTVVNCCTFVPEGYSCTRGCRQCL